MQRVAVALLAVLAVTGCSSDDAAEPAPPTVTQTVQPSESASAATAVVADPPLELLGGGTGRTCTEPQGTTDLAFFDVSWKANTELDSIKFELTNPDGVDQIGRTINVPPMNFGGRIDFGGAATWDDRAEVLDDKFLFWSLADDMGFWSPTEGETGLAVLHIRPDQKALGTPAGASFDGITATYRTNDGETGTVSVADRNMYRAKGRC